MDFVVEGVRPRGDQTECVKEAVEGGYEDFVKT